MGDASGLSERAKAFSVDNLLRRADGAHVQNGRTSKIHVELIKKDLWAKFNEIGTEMVITKAGRRMFPLLKVKITGLDENEKYIVFMDIVSADNFKYRYEYQSSRWLPSGSCEPQYGNRIYFHPDSPALGKLWMSPSSVSFDKLKLTNNQNPVVWGQISLVSMHKYIPRIHIAHARRGTPPCKEILYKEACTFVFPETSFMTVTAYQNQQITKLKIESNPFAKGFRDTPRTKVVNPFSCPERHFKDKQPCFETLPYSSTPQMPMPGNLYYSYKQYSNSYNPNVYLI